MTAILDAILNFSKSFKGIIGDFYYVSLLIFAVLKLARKSRLLRCIMHSKMKKRKLVYIWVIRYHLRLSFWHHNWTTSGSAIFLRLLVSCFLDLIQQKIIITCFLTIVEIQHSPICTDLIGFDQLIDANDIENQLCLFIHSFIHSFWQFL